MYVCMYVCMSVYMPVYVSVVSLLSSLSLFTLLVQHRPFQSLPVQPYPTSFTILRAAPPHSVHQPVLPRLTFFFLVLAISTLHLLTPSFSYLHATFLPLPSSFTTSPSFIVSTLLYVYCIRVQLRQILFLAFPSPPSLILQLRIC